MRSDVCHVAGFVVSAVTSGVERLGALLSATPGFLVHAQDGATGRLVVTLETDSVEDQEARFAWMRSLHGVQAVDLVYHEVST